MVGGTQTIWLCLVHRVQKGDIFFFSLFFFWLFFLLILEGGNLLLFWLSILSAVIYFWPSVKCLLSALDSCCCSFLFFPPFIHFFSWFGGGFGVCMCFYGAFFLCFYVIFDLSQGRVSGGLWFVGVLLVGMFVVLVLH